MAPVINANLLRVVDSRTREPVATDFSRPIGLNGKSPVEFEYDLASISRQTVVQPFVRASAPGLWRYGALLPVDNVAQGYADDVGRTPLITEPRLGAELGVELMLKLEGANPSGSFKDRGLAIAVLLGQVCGARRFCLPSQGNAGVSAAMFSARAGVPPPIVYMPSTHRGSLYHRVTASFGGEVRFAGAHVAEAGRKMRDDLAPQLAAGEITDLSTFHEPGRLEGKKTLGFELVEACGTRSLPDYIVYPTGGGTGLVGIWKAFVELRGLGVLDERAKLPKMIAVQSERCAPLCQAFAKKETEVAPVESRSTVAIGLEVAAPLMGHGMLRVLRESHGLAVAVTEQAIAVSFSRFARVGVGVSYEGAATLAALDKLRAENTIPAGSRVVLVLTASQLYAIAAARAVRS